jgi:hypothetical protein
MKFEAYSQIPSCYRRRTAVTCEAKSNITAVLSYDPSARPRTRPHKTSIFKNAEEFGVPYGIRTRVAAVKEKRPIVIQRNFAAWIGLYRTLRIRETLIGRLMDVRSEVAASNSHSGLVSLLKFDTQKFKPSRLMEKDQELFSDWIL